MEEDVEVLATSDTFW